MTTSPSPIRFSAPRHTTAEISAKKAKDYEAAAQLVEDLIPNFKKQEEKQFYREVVQSYRAAARNILRKALSDDTGQDIAEHAVMLASNFGACCGHGPNYRVKRKHRFLASCQFDTVIQFVCSTHVTKITDAQTAWP